MNQREVNSLLQSSESVPPQVDKPVVPDDFLALRIRNLIAAREANTAEANRELQSGDGWLWDHGKIDRELAAEIDDLLRRKDVTP